MEKYYLLSANCNDLCIGTIIKYDGVYIYNLENSNYNKMIENIPPDWITVDKEEAFYLVKINIKHRLKRHKNRIFDAIKKLNINDQCYYLLNGNKYIGTIKEIINNSETGEINYELKTESDDLQLVAFSDIELLKNDKIIFNTSLPLINKEYGEKGTSSGRSRLFPKLSLPVTESDWEEKGSPSKRSRLIPEFQKKFSRTIFCEEINMNIINPEYINKVVTEKKISKYFLSKRSVPPVTLYMKWWGKINDIYCFGCILPFVHTIGTNGWFNARKIFECENKRAIFIDADNLKEECISTGKHVPLITNNDNSIMENCICCIEKTDEEVKIPLNETIIIIINSVRRFVNCLWSGRINGIETIGVELGYRTETGTDGTFCGTSLFACKEKCGVLYQSRYIEYVPLLEFVDETYLRKDYELTKFQKETNFEEMGKILQVRDNPEIFGRVLFRMSVLDVTIVALEINLDCIPKNKIKLDNVLYDDNGIHGILVKVDKVELFNEMLKYKSNNGIVDLSSEIIQEEYQSEHFKIKDTVTYYTEDKEDRGNIIEFRMINNVRCVKVEDLYQQKSIYIPENNVRKFGVVDIFGTSDNNIISKFDQQQNSHMKLGTGESYVGDSLIETGNKPIMNHELNNYNEVHEHNVVQEDDNECQNIVNVMDDDFYKDTFLKKDFDFSSVETDQRGIRVHMRNYPRIEGEALFTTSRLNELLVGIKINFDNFELPDELLINVRLFNYPGIEGSIIIVKLKDTDLIDCPAKVRGECIINMENEYESQEKFKNNDIVKYKNGGEQFYGKFVKMDSHNNIRWVVVEDCISFTEDYTERYIREDQVEIVTDEQSVSDYFENSIFDIQSVVGFGTSYNGDMDIDSEIEFTLSRSGQTCNGKIITLVEVNSTPAAVVELCFIPQEINLTKYKIPESWVKDINTFNKITVIVKRSVLRKRITCKRNKVTILDPSNVKTFTTSSLEDKLISFRSEGNTVVAKLKWTGVVNKEKYMGCEMRNKSEYGTNGTFGDKRLFDCEEDKGVLIKVDNTEECCVNGHHKEVKKSNNGRINGESVCCAKELEILKNKSDLKLGERIMNRKENIFGICRWMGLVNNKEEIIGVEMVQCCETAVNDEWIDKLALFDSSPNKGGLFLPQDFNYDPIGLGFCFKNNIRFVISNNIKTVENFERLNKKIICKVNNKPVILDVRCRVIVNEEHCVGSELTYTCKCGFDGKLKECEGFTCIPEKGFLIPTISLNGSCEYINFFSELYSKSYANGHSIKQHSPIIKYNNSAINPTSFCCIEKCEIIKQFPEMKIGSKLIFRPNSFGDKKIGNCKWMGLINGKESVGVNIKDDVYLGDYNAGISFKELFGCRNDQGAIFSCEDVEHDIEGEKLHFLVDKVVDLSKIWKVKILQNDDINGMKIGDYVSTSVNEDDRGEVKQLKGELKWIGKINGEKCVGIDLEEEYPKYGMDGIINNKHRFKCLSLHGVVTKIDGLHKIPPNIEYINEGMINGNKYLKCEENWNEEYLKEKNVFKDGLLFVIINDDNEKRGRWKRKGTLRWSGVMNGLIVAVVELDQYCEHGTNGVFWRQRLITCRDKRAVAVSWDNIHEYIPFEDCNIPEDLVKFKEIALNSAVVYYVPCESTMKSLYGTVKWIGINEFDEYLYGIELDDRYPQGTDGQFKNQRLFTCQNYFGILAPIEEVAPDVRFTILALTDDDIPQSGISTTCQYSIPVKNFNGEHFGIQGNANSCYFDSSIFALFSKSDVLDFMISPRINEIEKNEVTQKFRDIMAWEIVYPLRELGFVSFHKTKQMRDVIKNYGAKFEEMTKHETDMENVAALLAKLCPDDQLLRLTTFINPESICKNSGMFLQLFVTLDRPVQFISSQKMLDISMAQNEIMFEKAPTCLIMQAPRDARGINCYENVLPSKTIEISKLCFNSFKKCSECDKIASWQCKICLEKSLRIKDALFCNDHNCQHTESAHVPDSSEYSLSEIQMELVAIICIEKAHFVTYVKEDNFKNEWVFFDSMSTQNVANNYSVPKVTPDNNITQFLRLDEIDMEQYLIEYIPANLKRIVKDSYIFVYHNACKTCY